jgi:uncharacterized protein
MVAGALMVTLTHLAYSVLAANVPGVIPATRALFGLLNVTGFSGTERAALIVVVASCEEVLFRGPLIPGAKDPEDSSARRLGRSDFRRIFGSAAAYAFATVPLGSPLLIICAFLCGSVWGVMGVATGSLTMPILAHVIWDLGVLLVWPISPGYHN